jgi:hypothetical protein
MLWLAAVLLIAILLSLPAHSNSPMKQAPHSQTSQASTDAKAVVQRGTEDAPLVVKTLPAEKTDAERQDEARERAERSASEQSLVNYTAALAIFTAVLAISTVALWWATKGLRDFAAQQAADMKSSIAVARQAADAAKMSADAAVAADLPIFVVESKITIGRREGTYSIPFGNHGRTPAVMMADCLVLELDKALPDKPRYPIHSLERVDRPRVVEKNHEYTVSRPASVSDADWDRILKRETILWAYGYIEYIDFLKIKRRDGFCLAFEPISSALYPTATPSDGIWVQEGPEAFVYIRTTDSADHGVDA